MNDDALAAEQPTGDSQAQGIFSADDALNAVMNMDYDNGTESIASRLNDETEEILESSTESEEQEGSTDSEEVETQDSVEEQSAETSEEQPETTELPSDDLVIAQEDDVTVTLGDLRESYAQKSEDYKQLEAKTTKKLQALAEQSKKYDEAVEKSLSSHQLLMNQLSVGLNQLDQTTDWKTLKSADPGEFQAKLQQRNQLEGQLQHFSQQAQQVLAEAQETKRNREQAEKKAALDFLHENINGWNQDAYNKVARYAESQGVANFLSINDGAVIKVIHDQMRAAEAKETALSKRAGKEAQPAEQKATAKKPASSKKQRSVAKLADRARKGDKGAAVDWLMTQPYDN